MAAGVTTRLWEVSDLVALLEAEESKKSGVGRDERWLSSTSLHARTSRRAKPGTRRVVVWFTLAPDSFLKASSSAHLKTFALEKMAGSRSGLKNQSSPLPKIETP